MTPEKPHVGTNAIFYLLPRSKLVIIRMTCTLKMLRDKEGTHNTKGDYCVKSQFRSRLPSKYGPALELEIKIVLFEMFLGLKVVFVF